MEEFPNKFEDIILISPIPDSFRGKNVTVNPNECFLNARSLAAANPGMTIIEGVMLGIHETGARKFYSHVWNKFGDLYFDITGEMILANNKDISQLAHSPGYEYTAAEFPTGSVFEFRKETSDAAKDLNATMEAPDGQW